MLVPQSEQCWGALTPCQPLNSRSINFLRKISFHSTNPDVLTLYFWFPELFNTFYSMIRFFLLYANPSYYYWYCCFCSCVHLEPIYRFLKRIDNVFELPPNILKTFSLWLDICVFIHDKQWLVRLHFSAYYFASSPTSLLVELWLNGLTTSPSNTSVQFRVLLLLQFR